MSSPTPAAARAELDTLAGDLARMREALSEREAELSSARRAAPNDTSALRDLAADVAALREIVTAQEADVDAARQALEAAEAAAARAELDDAERTAREALAVAERECRNALRATAHALRDASIAAHEAYTRRNAAAAALERATRRAGRPERHEPRWPSVDAVANVLELSSRQRAHNGVLDALRGVRAAVTYARSLTPRGGTEKRRA